MSADEKIIYEPHPVTPERKKELRQQGYTIIDAIFAPEGVKVGGAENKDPIDSLTKPQLQAWLKEHGVAFETDANKPALVELAKAKAKELAEAGE
jgi:hypothetical protein